MRRCSDGDPDARRGAGPHEEGRTESAEDEAPAATAERGPGAQAKGGTAVTEKQIRVEITDLLTGEKETVEVGDDYLLICAGSAYEDNIQVYGNGTHVITVKGRKR